MLFTLDIARAYPDIRHVRAPEAQTAAVRLPLELGRVEEEYRPAQASAKSAFIFYIQTVHGSPATARRIRKITNYLQKNYGTEVVLAEGAADKLHPEFLKFFSQPQTNRKALNVLTEEGILTGADLALLNPKIRGDGIENAGAYRRAYKLFKQVLGRLGDSRNFVEKQKSELDREASRTFSAALRETVGEWERFQSIQRDFQGTVRFLDQASRKEIDLDFKNPFSQFEWPQMTRLVLIQELAQRKDAAKFSEEKKKLLQSLSSSGLTGGSDSRFRGNGRFLKRLETGKPMPRRYFERFLEAGAAKGLELRRYPQVVYAAASAVLQDELDARVLYD